ncbi:aspartyl-phosphate phosphatase Spo0E family protein [Aquibacillus saliphilus]|uniref:aspartyl-phosphate phosphatase Spo0E family protein n=1 Tax=Aquibacillus saliphilus TaxID=1909422 RepID=UPI001CEFCC58
MNHLEIVSRDICMLRNLMYQAKNHSGSMSDPLVIEISQYLDLKLNQHEELIEFYRCENGGIDMSKNDKQDDKHIDNKSQSKTDEEQLQWQRSVIREEHITSK